jgi:type II secretory pathway component PulK
MHLNRAPVARDRRGIALLTTMLLIILLLVAIVGAFTRASGEFRTANDTASQVDALALAQSGLDRYLVAQTSLPGTLPDSQVFTMTGGRAVVTLRAARLSANDSTYVLISRGENTSTNRYAANTATAVRTVAQLLRRSSGGFTS